MPIGRAALRRPGRGATIVSLAAACIGPPARLVELAGLDGRLQLAQGVEPQHLLEVAPLEEVTTRASR